MNVVCIFVCRLEVRQFSFLDIYRQIRHFESDYHRFTTTGFIKKSRHLKYQNAAFAERTTSHELHAIALVLWNWAHIKRYHLVRDQVKCNMWNMWTVKMATGHFPTGSHNFAWNGHVNNAGMTTVTLQIKCDPTMPFWYRKVAYPLEISSGSGIYSDAVSHLPATQHRQHSDRPTTLMLFTVISSPSHVNHVATIMTLLSFTEF